MTQNPYWKVEYRAKSKRYAVITVLKAKVKNPIAV
jgi:hypothetical protein